MNKALPSSQSGLTLIEIFITMTLLSILSVTVFGLWNHGLKLFLSQWKQIRNTRDLQSLWISLSSELRASHGIISLGPHSVSFWAKDKNQDGKAQEKEWVTYQWEKNRGGEVLRFSGKQKKNGVLRFECGAMNFVSDFPPPQARHILIKISERSKKRGKIFFLSGGVWLRNRPFAKAL